MRLESIKIKNFRAFKNSGWIRIASLTAFVGRNDVGKSSILSALECFFDSSSKMSECDVYRSNDMGQSEEDVEISCLFTGLPEHIILDDSNETTFEKECLTTANGALKIIKRYELGSSAKVYIECSSWNDRQDVELMRMSHDELKSLLKEKGLSCDMRTKAEIRATLRAAMIDECCADSTVKIRSEISVQKRTWDKLVKYLPTFYLFKADRENTNEDVEIKNPIQDVIRKFLSNDLQLQKELGNAAGKTLGAVAEFLERIIQKMATIDKSTAQHLRPVLPSVDSLKWGNLFRDIMLLDEHGISVENRGSGVRRIMALAFFLVDAERCQAESDGRNVIYAIEEPETAQHSDMQRMLLDAVRSLSGVGTAQILITTHSSHVVQALSVDDVRIVEKSSNGSRVKEMESNEVKYSSMNAVNYHVFGDCLHEYHDELYGLIEAEKKMPMYENESRIERRDWIHEYGDGHVETDHKSLSYYIRNWIHHPENGRNNDPSLEDIHRSIDCMFEFAVRNHLLARRQSFTCVKWGKTQ